MIKLKSVSNYLYVFFSVIVLLYAIQYTVFKNITFKELISYFGLELYRSLDKSTTKQPTHVLILGDSTGQQIYNNREYSDSLYSLCCNQAITMIGQYILLQNFFEVNRNIKPQEVVLIYHPVSFQNDLDQKFTYHYFLKPFYNNQYKEFVSKPADKKIQKIPFHSLSQFPVVKLTNWSPKFEYNDNFAFDDMNLSETSIEYLIKIKNLLSKHNVNFKVISPYMNSKFLNHSFMTLKNQIKKYNLESIFENYFVDMKFVDEAQFVDELHLSENFNFKYNCMELQENGYR